MERNTDKEFLFGKTKIYIMDYFAMIKEMDMENINGKMVIYIRVVGKTTYPMAKVNFTCMVHFYTMVYGKMANL